jgi:hypothetical protein
VCIVAREFPRSFVGNVHASPLRPGQKKSLLWSVPINGGSRLRPAREGHVCQLQTAIVDDVFSQCELSIHAHIVDDCVRRVLAHEAGGTLVVVGGVFRGPPVSHVPFPVELVARVVEGVAQLVAHDRRGQPEVVADPLLVLRARRVRSMVQNGRHAPLVEVVHWLENRPVRTVGGNGIALEPAAAGVLVEVRTRIGAAVDRLDIKPEGIR